MKYPAILTIIATTTINSNYTYANNEFSDIETISVYGQFNPVNKNTMPSSVFIMNSEDISPIVGNTALDVLAQVPGIIINKSGNVQDIFLRGAESNFVIIQIDGVQVNNPLDTRGGGFDLASLNKDIIARVEVIKGAQSSIYGSDAIAGVINFITVDSQLDGAILSLGYMDEGQKSATIKAGFESWGVSLSGLDTDEQNNGDSQKLAEFAIHGKHKLSSNSLTQVNWRFSDYQQLAFPDQSGGNKFAVDTTKEIKDGQISSASIRHQHTITDAYHTSLQLEHYQAKDTLKSPGIAPYFLAPPSLTKNDYSMNKLRWLNAFSANIMSATVGIDYKTEEGDSAGYLFMFGQEIPTNYQQSRDNLAAFIDAKIDFSAAQLFLGARLDKPENMDNETTWKFGVNYDVNDHIRVFANAGEAFKLPSLYALGNNLIGNPDLLPETANNIDFGVEWHNENSDISFSIFDYQYKNLIDFDGETFSLVNRSSINTQGAELVFSTNLTANSQLKGNLTYADVESGEDELLTGRPEWQGGISLNWQWSDNFSTFVSANYIGESTATSLYTGDFSINTLPSYNKFDISANYRVTKTLNADFYLTNALDKKYYHAVGFNGAERGFGIKLNWQFL